jgi:hypothetical protein
VDRLNAAQKLAVVRAHDAQHVTGGPDDASAYQAEIDKLNSIAERHCLDSSRAAMRSLATRNTCFTSSNRVSGRLLKSIIEARIIVMCGS